MATDDKQRTDPAPRRKNPVLGRDRLARLVVVGSFLTLFLLAGVLIAMSQGSNKEAATAASNAFNAILPVLAGWVGTVLAFYFSSANQEDTNAILDRTIGRVAGGSTALGALVSEKMIPASKIFGLRHLDQTPPDQITIKDLQDDFARKLPNGAAVTRLLFVDNAVFKFVLHGATLNAFLVGSPTDATTGSFDLLLKDSEIAAQITKLVVFVAATATLADAKTALDKVAGAQDIIVTPTGNATEPMLGWLSNVDLTKAITVS